LTWTPAPPPRVLKWDERPGSKFADGVQTVQLENWTEFAEFLGQFVPWGNYIWRGHSRDTWRLEPSLDRLLRDTGKAGDDQAVHEHLDRFELAVRGRRGANPTRLTKEELWALGQHYGLPSPLLDWTASPFVAAFFAFEERDHFHDTPQRSVFALETGAIVRRSIEITGHLRHGPSRGLRVVRPRNYHDQRLISQGGLFTRGPNGVDIETWVRTYFRGCEHVWKLVRINLPSSERSTALKALNRMNINHLSLFPDLSGAARYCRMALEVTDYDRPEGVIGLPETWPSLDSTLPPEPRDFAKKGRELDAAQLMGISRTNAKLLEIEKRMMAVIGQTGVPSSDFNPWGFEPAIELLRSAGIRHTAELEAAISEVDADSLVALLSEFGFHQVRAWDTMPSLAIFAGAIRLDETEFDRFFKENRLTFPEGSAAMRARFLRVHVKGNGTSKVT
jgi:hypothetical protein